VGTFLQTAYRKLVPSFFRRWVLRHRRARLDSRILDMVINHRDSMGFQEKYANELSFLSKEGFVCFPYAFTRKYVPDSIEVSFDEQCGLPYVKHGTRRLYFPDAMGTDDIRQYYNQILIEQDAHSPHRYLTPRFMPSPQAVIADIGAAEGNFSLEIIENAAHCYLFEPDDAWHIPLRQTFMPWREKVTVVPLFASNNVNERTTTLDAFFQDRQVDFIKMDAEGEEPHVIEGAHKTLRDKVKHVIACTYHKQNHFDLLSGMLAEIGFTIEASDQCMLFSFDTEQSPPFFRKGLIRGGRIS
jgi:hypothetical protein